MYIPINECMYVLYVCMGVCHMCHSKELLIETSNASSAEWMVKI